MELLIALAIATAVLVLIPGPNVALIVATSMAFGARAGLAAVAGTSCGLALQLTLTVAGLAALVAATAEILIWLKWAGVAYLVWLGIRTWRQPAGDLGAIRPRAPTGRLFWTGFGVAAVNPKTLIFNSAFLPQFVSQGSNVALETQFVLVGAVFMGVMVAGDSLWALAASRAGEVLRRFGRARNRISGAILIGAGAALALARR